MKEKSNIVESPDWISILDVLYREDILVTSSKSQADRDIDDLAMQYMRTGDFYIFQGGNDEISELDMSHKKIELELERLADLELIKLIDFQHAPSKKKYRLTDEGFKIIHDLHKAKREEEWESQRQKWRQKQQDLQASVKNINTTLAAATIILAGSAVVQSLDQIQTQTKVTAILLTIALASCYVVYRHRRWLRGMVFN